jgi:D-alanyl-lipoteichoic acid acyltransferase DltB (MBOAT superfamily)
LSTLLVFFVSGFWHGANWTFVLWGILHGMIIIIEKVTGFDKRSKSLFINILKGGLVFIVVSCLWVLFRSPSIEIATLFFQNLFHNFNLATVLPSIETIIILLIFISFDFLTRHSNFGTWLNDKSVYIRWGIYFLLGFLIMSQSGTDMQPFIYFQF